MKIALAALLTLIIIIQTSIFLFDITLDFQKKKPIKVGLVFSTTGSNAKNELLAQQATLLAINEINDRGGLLGREIVPIIHDAQSDWKNTKDSLDILSNNERVRVIFGCGNQWNTEELQKILEQSNTLLIIPKRYLGTERSPNIIYLGITANQQIPPTLDYCIDHIGNNFFLVGSNEITSVMINGILRYFIHLRDATLQGDYTLEGETDEMDKVIMAIVDKQPQIILNSLSGDLQSLFFRKLRLAGINPSQLPIFSFNLTQMDLSVIDIEDLIGSYATWNYFQSLGNEANSYFKKSILKFANTTSIDNSAEAAYNGVHLWAKAVTESGGQDINLIRNALKYMSIQAPEGPLTMNREGDGAWKFSKIGKVTRDRQFEVIWETNSPIAPFAFPPFQLESERANVMEPKPQIESNPKS